eukprot:447022-Amphidinium_carterae.3
MRKPHDNKKIGMLSSMASRNFIQTSCKMVHWICKHLSTRALSAHVTLLHAPLQRSVASQQCSCSSSTGTRLQSQSACISKQPTVATRPSPAP